MAKTALLLAFLTILGFVSCQIEWDTADNGILIENLGDFTVIDTIDEPIAQPEVVVVLEPESEIFGELAEQEEFEAKQDFQGMLVTDSGELIGIPEINMFEVEITEDGEGSFTGGILITNTDAFSTIDFEFNVERPEIIMNEELEIFISENEENGEQELALLINL